MIGGYLRRANLPSRKEVLELAESLRRIEDKLDRLLPADSTPRGAAASAAHAPPMAACALDRRHRLRPKLPRAASRPAADQG